MKKITTMVLLLLIFSQSQSKTLNKIFEDSAVYDPEAFDLGSKSILINGRLLFAGRSENGSSLWAMDTNTLDKTELLSGYQSRLSFIRLGDFVYFNFNTDNSSGTHIWRTDGSIAGTTQVYQESVDHLRTLYQVGNVVYTESSDNQTLVVIDEGENAFVHDLKMYPHESFCALNAGEFIAHEPASGNEPPKYKFSRAGVSVTELSIPFPQDYARYNTELVQHDNDCYVVGHNELSVNGFGGDLLKIESAGVVNVSELYELDNDIQSVVSHQGRLYLLHVGGKISRLNDGETAVDLTKDEGAESRYNLYSQGPYLASIYHPPVSPPVIVMNFLDSELNFLGSRSDYSRSSNEIPEIHSYNNGVLMELQRFVGISGDSEGLIFNPFQDDELTLTLTQGNSNKVITNPNSDQIYLLTNNADSRATLYAVEDAPNLGAVTSGLWHDEEVLNQGLSIHVGKRADGSEYVFVTVYTFKDGAPFWLAGVSDITYPQSKVDVVMGDYNDSDMFDPGGTPMVNIFGTLQIEMTACNKLKATIVNDEDDVIVGPLNLSRIDDVTHSNQCSE